MNRRGDMNTLKEILIMLVILGIIVAMVVYMNRNTRNALDGLKDCGFAAGLISGNPQAGKCFADKSCTNPAVAAPSDSYFQYGGSGLGCTDQSHPFCCLLLPKSQNPLSGTKIAAAHCQSLAEGTWGYQAVGATDQCTPITNGQIPIKLSQQLNLYYKPKTTDVICKIDYSIGGGVTYGKYQQYDCIHDADSNGIVSFSIGSVVNIYKYSISQGSSHDYTELDAPTQIINLNLIAGPDSQVSTTSVSLRISNDLNAKFCPKSSDTQCRGERTAQSGGNSHCTLMEIGPVGIPGPTQTRCLYKS